MKKIKLESVFNEFTLMGIAVSGAFYLGEYWEGIAVILFYLIGEWFQHKAVYKPRSGSACLLCGCKCNIRCKIKHNSFDCVFQFLSLLPQNNPSSISVATKNRVSATI